MKLIGKFLKKRWWFLIIIAVVIGAATSTVEIYKEEVLNIIDTDVEYKTQKSLSFASNQIDTLNPICSESEDVYYITKLIYNSLFAYDENLSAVPELVSEYTIDTEKAYILVTLNTNIQFHDGSYLDADDVIFTVKAIQAAGENSPYYKQAKKILSIFAKSSSQVAIYFNNNYNCSLDDLTFPIVSSSGQSSVTQFINDKNFVPVGTGRYQYKSYNSHKYLRLVPNESYFGKASSKNIYIRILPDKSKASNLMEIEEVICYTDSGTNRKSSVNGMDYQIYDFPSNNLEFIVLSTNSYLASNDLRKALCYSIDTVKILESAYMGDGVLSDTIYYPNFLGVLDTGDAYAFDSDKAKAMYEEFGFKDTNEDGFYEYSSGEMVTIRIVVNKSNSMRVAAAKQIKKQLAICGINSEVSILSKADYEKAIENKKYDILLTGYTINENYDLRSFFNGKAEWKYTDYKLSNQAALLDRLYSSEKYTEYYEKLKEMIIDKAVYYPICYRNMSLIGVSTFEAEELPMFNNLYLNCESWSWKKEL